MLLFLLLFPEPILLFLSMEIDTSELLLLKLAIVHLKHIIKT